MRGSRLLLVASIFLSLFGAVNFLYAITMVFIIGAYDLGISEVQGYIFIGTYGLIQGVIPLVYGLLGLIWHNNIRRTKIIYYGSYFLLAVYYYLFFFTSYGQGWTVILFDLGCVIVALVYFQAARMNYEEMKAIEESRKKEE